MKPSLTTENHNSCSLINRYRVKSTILSVRKSTGVGYQLRPLTYTPYSRKNWSTMSKKIYNFFHQIEDDFRLLHKPYLQEAN